MGMRRMIWTAALPALACLALAPAAMAVAGASPPSGGCTGDTGDTSGSYGGPGCSGHKAHRPLVRLVNRLKHLARIARTGRLMLSAVTDQGCKLVLRGHITVGGMRISFKRTLAVAKASAQDFTIKLTKAQRRALRSGLAHAGSHAKGKLVLSGRASTGKHVRALKFSQSLAR